MLGVEAKDMETKPAAASDYIPCSDHCGVRLSLTIQVLVDGWVRIVIAKSVCYGLCRQEKG